MRRESTKGLAIVLALVSVALMLGPAFAAEPLATAYTETDGIEIDLMSMERKGSVLTIKWAVRNEGDAETTVKFDLTRAASTYLVDEENGTKYFVLTDEGGRALSSPTSQGYIGRKLAPGKVVRLWAKFPAPPPEVTKINVIFSGAEPIEGVRITDKEP